MRILVIDVDSLRPDHLGCYGYERDTSPNIDALADDGVRFEECYVSDSPCLPSRTALATCRFGAKSGVVTHFGSGQRYDEPGEGHTPDPERPLAFRHLLENGVRTATVTSFSQRHLAYHFTASFQEHVQPSTSSGTVAMDRADDVTGEATRWLDDHAADDDWLLHVNYWDVHHPYSGIEEHAETIRESGPAAAWPDQEAIDGQQGSTGPRTVDLWPTAGAYDPESASDLRREWPFPDHITDREQVDHLFTGYDASIRKVDEHVGALLEKLEAEGIREETAVVVTGDHGEAFGEHGVYVEHAFPDAACQRVPMIVSWPGVTDDGGRAVDAFVHQFDLLPTICELGDVPVPDGWDAETFAPALRGDGFEGREFLVSGHGIYTFGRAVYTEDWTYVRLHHPGVFSVPGLYNDVDLPNEGLELLHDRDDDPHGETNLAGERPEVLAEMRAKLDGWVNDVVATPEGDAGGVDPLARMAAEDGPFLYTDEELLVDLYRDLGRSERQLSVLARRETFPRELDR